MNVRALRLGLSLGLLWVAASCRGDDHLGPLESYRILGRAAGAHATGEAPVVEAMNVGEEPARTLARELESGFVGEMVRTVHIAKQLVSKGTSYPAEVRAAAAEPLLLLVGADGAAVETPSVVGLSFTRTFGAPKLHADVRWLGLSGNVEGDKALVQTLAGRLAAHAASWIATGARAGENPNLVVAYRLAMEVIAREWRPQQGSASALRSTAGTMDQRRLFATVRENEAVLTGDKTTLRPAAELLADPRVGATVLHRLAQTKGIAHTAGPEAMYAPFVAAGLPAGVSPAAVLGPIRNFQAKLLSAWAGAIARGQPPTDIVGLVEAYGALFPAERPELLRIFLVTTYGATVLPGGLSPDPKEATTTLARVGPLTDEVVAGKRGLRDAIAKAGTP